MYDADPELGDCPEFGMIFVLDADYSNVRWYCKARMLNV